MRTKGWWFWIDEGGTFTDVIARDPAGKIIVSKILSRTSNYQNPITHAVQQIAGDGSIAGIKVGTTVATNALLERAGSRCALVTTRGHGDAVVIGRQNRSHLFELHIKRSKHLYDDVIEIDERIDAQGEVVEPLNRVSLENELNELFARGHRILAVAYLNAYLNPAHERQTFDLASKIGFEHVVCSTDVNRLAKWLPRCETALLDAYLGRTLQTFVNDIKSAVRDAPCWTMTSAAGLTMAESFKPHDSLLSGPAGGLAGAIEVARRNQLDGIVTFDMGGTSTDVAAFIDEIEWETDGVLADVHVHAPMVRIHTIAAGGGSKLHFDGHRMLVGPKSAGAEPGPACYGRGGPLSLTDSQVVLGVITADQFPNVFGHSNTEQLDEGASFQSMKDLAKQIRDSEQAADCVEVAEGFVAIAVNQMASAIQQVTLARGLDVRDLSLMSFGGAAGQYACSVAEQLEITRIIVPQHASLLSAVGIGHAPLKQMVQRTFDLPLDDRGHGQLSQWVAQQQIVLSNQITSQGGDAATADSFTRVFIRPQGADFSIDVEMADLRTMVADFQRAYQSRFGFELGHVELEIDYLSLELSSHVGCELPFQQEPEAVDAEASSFRRLFCDGSWVMFEVLQRKALPEATMKPGPCLVVELHTTLLVKPGWLVSRLASGDLLLKRHDTKKSEREAHAQVDPVLLEVYRNRFQCVAEMMGTVLQRAALSVNIKERLDFSCAVFDASGNLVSNAPHMPVHIGSMDMSVRSLIERTDHFAEGESYALNDPYSGGTHLPDITVVSPVFVGGELVFFVASRGHHADVGGCVPGSMPANSRNIDEEGVLFRGEKISAPHGFLTARVQQLLSSGKWPARNVVTNIADLKAQIAANNRGASELKRWIEQMNLAETAAYMRHIQDYAATCVKRALAGLQPGEFELEMDNGSSLRLRAEPQGSGWLFDFSGSSPQSADNMNAPLAITRAVVLYVLRACVSESIPLNAGCLWPVEIRVPATSILNPREPAAVAAGNVETSQHLADLILAALGKQAASQGSMNNLCFGDGSLQYYETICGGSGAGPDFDGTDAIHTHMTNSRMTDSEILERRFPVRVNQFRIRRGSGGQGFYKGGAGVVREIIFLRPMQVSLLSTRRRTYPHGLNGGNAGLRGVNRLIRANGDELELPGCVVIDVYAGDLLRLETPGGGGFGAVNA